MEWQRKSAAAFSQRGVPPAAGGETISKNPTIPRKQAYLLAMDVSGRGKDDKQEKNADMSQASPKAHPTASRRDEAAVRTQVNMVSRFTHPRGTRFNLRAFVTRYRIPVALSCLALVGGTIAAVMVQRRRRDTWDARLDRLRQTVLDAAKGIG